MGPDGWEAVFDAVAGTPVIRQQAMEITQLRTTVAELVALLREARKVVNEIDSIMSESRGVSGYHLNGNIAEWDEFDDLSESGAVVDKIDAAIARHGGA